MAVIALTRGQIALVDDEDYAALSEWKWNAQWAENTKSFYAQRTITLPNGKRTAIGMSRQIMGLGYGDSIRVDHKNSNTLDNQRRNLRLATNSQNLQNCRKKKLSKSRYKGVSWSASRGKWSVEIQVGSKKLWLGRFLSEHDAHLAYASAAKFYYGEFARIS